MKICELMVAIGSWKLERPRLGNWIEEIKSGFFCSAVIFFLVTTNCSDYDTLNVPKENFVLSKRKMTSFLSFVK